jgi:hypothetical protein
MKLFVQTGLGIVLLIAGVSLLYFFISGLSKGFNFIFLILSLVFIGAGTFLFFKVSKIANGIPEESAAIEPVPAESGSKLLEKNNQIVKDWTQATNKKENLKSVQMAVSAEVQAKSEE